MQILKSDTVCIFDKSQAPLLKHLGFLSKRPGDSKTGLSCIQSFFLNWSSIFSSSLWCSWGSRNSAACHSASLEIFHGSCKNLQLKGFPCYLQDGSFSYCQYPCMIGQVSPVVSSTAQVDSRPPCVRAYCCLRLWRWASDGILPRKVACSFIQPVLIISCQLSNPVFPKCLLFFCPVWLFLTLL